MRCGKKMALQNNVLWRDMSVLQTRRYWMYGRHAVFAAIHNKKRKILNIVCTAENADYVVNSVHTAQRQHCDVQIANVCDIMKILGGKEVIHQGIIADVECLEQPTLLEFIKKIDQKTVEPNGENVISTSCHNHTAESTVHEAGTMSCGKFFATQRGKNGVSSNVDSVDNFCANSISDGCLVVMLDKVNDPHNIGAIIRSAAAFSVCAVVTTRHGSPQESAVITKIASGGFEMVPFITVTNLLDAIKLFKKNGFWVFGLDCKAKNNVSVCRSAVYKRALLVLGSEECGMRRLIGEACDILLRVPTAQSRVLDSLNVSNAAAISMYSYFFHIPVELC